MRPSQPAAYGLLARTYLSMARYEDALIYADKALKLRNQLINFNDSGFVTIGAAFPFKRFNKETIFYSELPTTFLASLRSNYALIDTFLFDSYAKDDLRKTAFFGNGTGGYKKFKGSYAGANELFSGIGVDELYLIRAESLARTGEREESMLALNTLMINRWKDNVFVPFAAATDEEAIVLVLEERRKELVFRGLRWIDIKRLNLEFSNIELKRIIDGNEIILLPNDDRFALPLPSDIIRITGMPQNKF